MGESEESEYHVGMTIIRKANPSDIEFIVHSQIQLARETEHIELDPAIVRQGVSAVFTDAVMGDYYVALVDGKLVACMLALLEWSDWRNGNLIWIHSVYVISNYRRHGVFTEMYDHLKQIVLTSPGYRGLRLYVNKTNTHAQKVYEKLKMNKEHYELFEWLRQ